MIEKHDIHGFECCYCPKTFTSEDRLLKHAGMYHPLRPARNMNYRPCKDCQLFINVKEARDHMEIEHEKPNECPFCSFEIGKIEIHDVTSVQIQTNGTLTPAQKIKKHLSMKCMKRHTCQCHKEFLTKSDLNDHKSECTGTKYVQKRIEVVCNKCGETMDSQKLRKHRERFHPEDQPRNYACPSCPKKFFYASKLQSHLRQYHMPQAKLHCHLCEKSFSTEEYLKYHLSTVHEPPKLKCPFCEKLFRIKINVTQHMRGCHFPPSFECRQCGQRFHHRPLVSSHLKNQHGVAVEKVEETIRRIDVGLKEYVDKIVSIETPTSNKTDNSSESSMEAPTNMPVFPSEMGIMASVEVC